MKRQPAILQAAIDAGCSNQPGKSRLHGERHWKCVAEVGLWLADRLTEIPHPLRDPALIDRDFITTFALLHDLERVDDGRDQDHGQRAELMFKNLLHDGRLQPAWTGGKNMQRNAALMYALCYHCKPEASVPDWSPAARINVAICWDADRLCRYRLGAHERPDNAYLTTRQAKSRAAHLYASERCAERYKRSWTRILAYSGSLTRLGA